MPNILEFGCRDHPNFLALDVPQRSRHCEAEPIPHTLWEPHPEGPNLAPRLICGAANRVLAISTRDAVSFFREFWGLIQAQRGASNPEDSPRTRRPRMARESPTLAQVIAVGWITTTTAVVPLNCISSSMLSLPPTRED